MAVKQVRTKSNRYSTVKYDSAGNILTPSRKRELKKLAKEHAKKYPKGGPKWIKIVSKFNSKCCNCDNNISVGTEILWNKKNKNIKHVECV
jgi:hypothetical protein